MLGELGAADVVRALAAVKDARGRSIHVRFQIEAALVESDLPPGQKSVLMFLLARVDDLGQCWPSLARVAKDSGWKRRTVIRLVQLLELAGWLEARRRHSAKFYERAPGEPRSTLYTARVPAAVLVRLLEASGVKAPAAVELPEAPPVELPEAPPVELPEAPPVELPEAPAAVELPEAPPVELPEAPAAVELPEVRAVLDMLSGSDAWAPLRAFATVGQARILLAAAAGKKKGLEHIRAAVSSVGLKVATAIEDRAPLSVPQIRALLVRFVELEDLRGVEVPAAAGPGLAKGDRDSFPDLALLPRERGRFKVGEAFRDGYFVIEGGIARHSSKLEPAQRAQRLGGSTLQKGDNWRPKGAPP